MRKHLLPLLLLFALSAQAQKMKKEDKALLAKLQQHVQFLSSDALGGRRTGTEGEQKAAAYIAAAFEKAGLQPKGSAGFYQYFEINEGRQVNEGTALRIDGQPLRLTTDFFPLNFSGNGSITAAPSMALQEPGMPWFFDLKELMEANSANPHFDLAGALKERAAQMKAKGASALLVYNSGTAADGLRFNGRDRTETLDLPVVYLSAAAARKYLQDPSATLEILMKVDIGDKKRSGGNVVGYLDNGAPTTVVIGAHYDHLGNGEDGNTRETGQPAIHNGADDNASGTAALIELAGLLKGSKLRNNNYLFIAFSGEELGLYGSKHFTEQPTIDMGSVNYMINMDMIGRLNDSSRTVTVGGYGTSPGWGQFYALKKGKSRLYAEGLSFRFDSSGTGPSDHTSFYRKNIPVLFYFTGLHSDYHKPTDDADKINYNGQLRLLKHIYSLVVTADHMKERLVFTKTREAQTTTSARFSVSLGIMPDYTYSGAGVRVDGVSEGRAAQKGGIVAGDIITALGETRITSMESYMQALSKFKKGDSTRVSYTRGGETLSTTIVF